MTTLDIKVEIEEPKKTTKYQIEKMVNLLLPNQLRILSGVLCFISIGCIVSHCLIFVLLVSNMQTMEIPYSLMGQGIWTGITTIGTASLMLSFANSKSKERLLLS